MTRKITALLVVVFLASSSFAADSKKLLLRWHGQSFFSLETSQGTRIVFDPHAIEQYGRPVLKADLILMSHLHDDHTQKEVIQNVAKAKAISGLKGTGKKIDWNLIDEKFQDVRIRTVGVYHDDMKGLERGKNVVFCLEVDGLKIVHLGDLGHLLTDDQVKKIGPVDVLMIPVGGVYTINGSEAKKVVEQLKPTKYILPMHYGTRVFDDLLTPEEFLDEQKKTNIRKLDNTNKLVIDTDFKPVEPVIVLMNWK